MPREFLNVLNFSDMRNFIKKIMQKNFDTSVIIKLKNVKALAAMQEFEFEMVGSNGVNAQGVANFTDFGCTMQISYGKNKIYKVLDKEWAHYVYNSLKEKDEFGLSEYKHSEVYKLDYNAHLQAIKEEKQKFADIEYEENMIK